MNAPAVKLDLPTLKLEESSHDGPEDGFCVMEAVAYMAGEPWSDKPKCASPAIAGFLRSWNDGMKDDERQALKQYIPRLINSRGSDWLEVARAYKAVDWNIHVRAAAFLEDAGLTDHATNLRALPEIRTPKDLEIVVAVVSAARSAADSAARSAALARIERVKKQVMESAHELVHTLLNMTEADGEAARRLIIEEAAA